MIGASLWIVYIAMCWLFIAWLTARKRADRRLAKARQAREAREVDRAVETVLRRVK